MSNAFALGKWIRGSAVEEITPVDALVNQMHPVVYISQQVRERPHFLPTGSYVVAANKQSLERDLASPMPLPSEIAALAAEMEASILGNHSKYDLISIIISNRLLYAFLSSDSQHEAKSYKSVLFNCKSDGHL